MLGALTLSHQCSLETQSTEIKTHLQGLPLNPQPVEISAKDRAGLLLPQNGEPKPVVPTLRTRDLIEPKPTVGISQLPLMGPKIQWRAEIQ